MQPKSSAFGVDFGTTNTRIVFHDRRQPIAIPVDDQHGRRVYNIPSIVGYSGGQPVAFGHEALGRNDIKVARSIKWLLARDELLEVDGEFLEPTQVVADFFRYLQQVVRKASEQIPHLRDNPDGYLERLSITVPVNFPFPARQALCRACEMAGIDVQAIFLEPVAALYSNPEMYRNPGDLAAFDWGGGTLDIATVRYRDNMAEVLSVRGMEWGGDDLDKLILSRVLDGFVENLRASSPTPSHELLDSLRQAWLQQDALISLSELAKIRLSESGNTMLTRARLLGQHSLNCLVARTELEEWFQPKVDEALRLLEECLDSASSLNLRRLLISGGTCNIPLVQLRLKQQFGTDRIEMPRHIETQLSRVDDTGMGTAVGAAMLTVHGGQPVFAQDIGIRLDEGTEDESFYTLYPRERPIEFGKPHLPSRMVAQLSPGQTQVALKICTRQNSINKQGSVFEIIPVPVNAQHLSFRVKCTVDKSLVLRIDYLDVPLPRESRQSYILDVPMIFRMPDNL